MKANKLIFHFSLPGYFRKGENYCFTYALTSFSFCSLLAVIRIFAPYRQYWYASCSPIPPEAPVMTTFLPLKDSGKDFYWNMRVFPGRILKKASLEIAEGSHSGISKLVSFILSDFYKTRGFLICSNWQFGQVRFQDFGKWARKERGCSPLRFTVPQSGII